MLILMYVGWNIGTWVVVLTYIWMYTYTCIQIIITHESKSVSNIIPTIVTFISESYELVPIKIVMYTFTYFHAVVFLPIYGDIHYVKTSI